MMTTCGIINEVENAGRFSLSIYNSPPRRPAFSTNKGTNWWAVIFGDTMTTHKCSTCGMEKPTSEFYKRKDGRPIYQCSECERKSVLSRSFYPKMDGTLVCTVCGKEKASTDFGVAKHHSTGRKSCCKKCEYAAQKKRNQRKNFPPKMTGTKVCWVCGKKKSVLDFHTRKVNKDGRMSACKECNAMRSRVSTLKNVYGISVEEFDLLYKRSGGQCEICGTPIEKWFKSLCIDHNHVTGKVRGVLCKSCNLLIGNAKDNVDILKSAIVYLTSV